jgi:hypothetical protein
MNSCIACGHRMQDHNQRYSNGEWMTYGCSKCDCGAIGHKV